MTTTTSATSSSSSSSNSRRKSFRVKLEERVAACNSLLCVGLDPHEAELFPENSSGSGSSSGITHAQKCHAALSFCKTIIDATLPYAACYKPNAAFFEALGPGGVEVLEQLIQECIPPEVPVLLDVKRGDIGSTAAAYAQAAYGSSSCISCSGSNMEDDGPQQQRWRGADAVTLSPLMGWDSVQPFVTGKYADRGAFLLCKTSNPGSNDLLALTLASTATSPETTVYERIATLVGKDWKTAAQQHQQQHADTTTTSNTTTTHNDTALLGLVVGATDVVALAKARAAAGPDVWILAPGVGAQGGSLREAVQAGVTAAGTGLLIPVSRGISRAVDPGQAARDLVAQIQAVRDDVLRTTAAAADDDDHDPTKTLSSSNATGILPHQRDFLEFSLAQGVLKFGSFVLKSGRTSPYFFNAGLFASGAALFQLGEAYASAIMASSELVENGKPKFDVMFGPAYKGISLGAVVSSALYRRFSMDIEFAYNRKEAKDHGEGGQLVGADMKGKRVLIIDDVITAGTAIRESYTMLQNIGAIPVAVVIALDRAEVRSTEDRISAVQAVERDLSLSVVSIASLPQVQTFLEQNPTKYGKDTLQQVIAYRTEYGV